MFLIAANILALLRLANSTFIAVRTSNYTQTNKIYCIVMVILIYRPVVNELIIEKFVDDFVLIESHHLLPYLMRRLKNKKKI